MANLLACSGNNDQFFCLKIIPKLGNEELLSALDSVFHSMEWMCQDDQESFYSTLFPQILTLLQGKTDFKFNSVFIPSILSMNA